MQSNCLHFAKVPQLLSLCLSMSAGFSALAQTAATASSGTPPKASTAVAEAQAKKPGGTCIAITMPKMQLAQGTGGPSGAGEALRASETQYLRGPALNIVPLSAMIPVQIAAELKEHDCGYLLYSSLAEKSSASGGSFLKKAMPLASMLPMAGMMGGLAGAVTTSAASVALTSAAGLAGEVKAKSEMTFVYRLVRVTNGVESPVLENTLKGKASHDGEDIISPMLEQAATAIVGSLSAKP